MPVAENLTMYLDQSRCIGCQSCVQACSECDTHKGKSMIHLETADRAHSVQTMPVVCMHCESPTGAEVCPADAIKKLALGTIRQATGTYTWVFVLLSLFSVACLGVCLRTSPRRAVQIAAA
jgi:Fe-S-cluster-containing dehydrogenase component